MATKNLRKPSRSCASSTPQLSRPCVGLPSAVSGRTAISKAESKNGSRVSRQSAGRCENTGAAVRIICISLRPRLSGRTGGGPRLPGATLFSSRKTWNASSGKQQSSSPRKELCRPTMNGHGALSTPAQQLGLRLGSMRSLSRECT